MRRCSPPACPAPAKSYAVAQLGVVDDGWRRLDADVVKDYLVDDFTTTGLVDDLLGRELADGHPVMPAELAALVHLESVAFIDELRADCLAQGENVVIEGTLSWPPAARQLLGELVEREYREVMIVDVEVPREVAHDQALDRWWHGRQERVAGHGQGGRFVPASAIDYAFTAADRHSVCAANVRAAFDSAAAQPRHRVEEIPDECQRAGTSHKSWCAARVYPPAVVFRGHVVVVTSPSADFWVPCSVQNHSARCCAGSSASCRPRPTTGTPRAAAASMVRCEKARFLAPWVGWMTLPGRR